MSVTEKKQIMVRCESCHDEVTVQLAPAFIGPVDIRDSTGTLILRLYGNDILLDCVEGRRILPIQGFIRGSDKIEYKQVLMKDRLGWS